VPPPSGAFAGGAEWSGLEGTRSGDGAGRGRDLFPFGLQERGLGGEDGVSGRVYIASGAMGGGGLRLVGVMSVHGCQVLMLP
jgi:hypothetical protein